MNLSWTNEKRKVNDLLPYVYNPRKMSVSQMKTLQDSLNQFGLVEVPVINTDGTLIAGHQRCKALQLLGRGDELIDVRVPNRMLDEKGKVNLLKGFFSLMLFCFLPGRKNLGWWFMQVSAFSILTLLQKRKYPIMH